MHNICVILRNPERVLLLPKLRYKVKYALLQCNTLHYLCSSSSMDFNQVRLASQLPYFILFG